MNRRAFIIGLMAAPAVVKAEILMPVRLWVPTIYGDAIHDDWEGLDALLNDRPVNIKAKIFHAAPAAPELGMTSIGNTYLLGRPLVIKKGYEWRRDRFINDTFVPSRNFPEDEGNLIMDAGVNATEWIGCVLGNGMRGV